MYSEGNATTVFSMVINSVGPMNAVQSIVSGERRGGAKSGSRIGRHGRGKNYTCKAIFDPLRPIGGHVQMASAKFSGFWPLLLKWFHSTSLPLVIFGNHPLQVNLSCTSFHIYQEVILEGQLPRIIIILELSPGGERDPSLVGADKIPKI